MQITNFVNVNNTQLNIKGIFFELHKIPERAG